MNKKRVFVALAAAMLFVVNAAFSQTVNVSGEVTSPLTLKKEDFAAYKLVSQTVKDRDAKEHTFKGVALIEILEKAGVTTGSKLRGENLAKAVLIKAADGYEAVYALPEIDPEFSESMVMLAFEKDGAPIPAGEGPFRIIAPKDKKPARWVREVREIKVVFVKE